MKKVILASVLAATAIASMGVAHAVTSQAICTGATVGGQGVAATVGSTTSDSFVKVAFTVKCSVNTHVVGGDNGVYYKVGSGSTKGKTQFAGSSAGGGVVAAGTCATTGCAVSDATTAMASTWAATS